MKSACFLGTIKFQGGLVVFVKKMNNSHTKCSKKYVYLKLKKEAKYYGGIKKKPPLTQATQPPYMDFNILHF